ncbi:cytochrome P450 [Zopfia rhizophila CBS 207.26]|uniref:Cytochrome P450 n=1 Tax=Zopfia rhizophila CBS 207.26 TaxID=1314779 RepID=A0A6A6EFP8_9PEZI|nr:cytochrome P450 [Zopfia rhizophila CBS 207.26]
MADSTGGNLRQAYSSVCSLGLPVIILICLVLVLVLWRLTRFTLLPLLHPEEPREVPYWTPFLGHAISYFRDPTRTLTYARNYFKDDRKPLTINLAGEMMYVITAPGDVTAVYRNSSTLTMDIFTQDLMRGFGVSESSLDRVFTEPNKDGTGLQLMAPNPNRKSLAHLTTDHFRMQLSPGDRLTQMGNITLAYVEKALRWENMVSQKFVIAHTSSYKDISLLHFCEEVILQVATRSFFGDALIDKNPNILEDFLQFDDVSWKLMYRYPRLLSPNMNKAKDKLIDALEKYFNLPQEERPGANWFVQMEEAEFRNFGVPVRDIAKLIASIYWVINTNTYKLLFWMLEFALHDLALLQKITEELNTCFNLDGTLDIPSLQSQSPYLTALFHECLRITNTSSSARLVTSDTRIGPYILRSGRRLLIPYQQLHLNTAAFGPNPASFDYTRFLSDPKLPRNPSFRPFGGGASYCPGRFVAKQEIFMAMAFLLCRFEVGMAVDGVDGKQKQNFPRRDDAKPGIGIVSPVRGDDLVVRLRIKN